MHVANSGGVWSALTHGFAGMRDTGDALSFDPRLPAAWEGLRLRLVRTGSLAEIEIDHRGHLIRVIDGEPLPVLAGGHVIHIRAGEEHRFEV